MALGQAQTDTFSIGTAELRVGPLSSAGQLVQANSIGLIDDAIVTIGQESAELKGGFPRKLVDSVVIEQTATVTATAREYSRANLNIMLGNGIVAAATEVKSTLATDELINAVSIDVQGGDGALFTVGDIITIYPEGKPEDVSVLEIGNIVTDTVTFVTGQTTVIAYTAADVVNVYVSHQISIGNVVQTNYFSCTLIQKDHKSGFPLVYNFWKVSSVGSLDVQTNAEDFSSMAMELNCLEPAASEYAASADLEPWANVIPTHPIGFWALGKR